VSLAVVPRTKQVAGVYRERLLDGAADRRPQLSSESVTVEGALLETLVQLRRVEPFLATVREGGGEAEFHVSMYARESFRLELASSLLSVLGRLRVAVAFDVYPQPHDPG
jgi:hypothetical protein